MADLNKIISVQVDDNASGNLKKIDDGLTKVTQSTSNHTKTTQSNTKSLLENGGAMGLLNDATGGLAMTFKDAAEAVGLSSNALKGFRGALLATGIGAIAVVLLELITNWDKWSGVIDGSTAALERQNVELEKSNKLFEDRSNAISEDLINYDLQIQRLEAIGASDKEIEKVQNQISKERARLANEQLYGIKNVTKGLLDQRGEAYRLLSTLEESTDKYKEQEKVIDDLSKRINEQIAIKKQSEADPELRKLTRERIQGEKDEAEREKARLKRLELTKQRYKELLAEANEFFKKAAEAQEADNKLREEQVNILNKNLPESPEDIAQSNLETLNAISQNEYLTFQQRLQNVKDFQEQIKSNEQLTAEVKEYYLNKSAETEKTILEAQMAYREQAYRTNYENLQNILSLGGKKLAGISKALAIADVVRTTYKSISASVASLTEANTKAVAASPLTGGQPWVTTNTIQTGIGIASAVASSIKSIQAITSEQKSIGSSGGSTSGAGGGGAAPQAQFNIVGASGTNQLAARIGAAQNQPVNAYVVGTDVSTQQALDRNRITNATFLSLLPFIGLLSMFIF